LSPRPSAAATGSACGCATTEGVPIRGDSRSISSYIPQMNAQDAIDTLRRYESSLRARGIRHAALFGSVARGQNRPDSDIDILVEFDPAARVTIFDYVGIKEYIADLFEQPVDVINREGLKPHLRESSLQDAIY